MKRIVIIGASGFGREIAWIVERLNQVRPTYEVLGFCDDADDKRAGVCAGYPLLGPVEGVAAREGAIGFFCAIGDNRTRQRVMLQAQAAGWEPVTLIDRDAVIAPDAAVGKGSYIGIGGVVSVGVKIGEGVIVNHHVTVGHDVAIGDYAQLCPGVRVSGGCHLGEGVLMGSNACTIPCVRAGAWATVGAGASVLRDVEDGGRLIRLAR